MLGVIMCAQHKNTWIWSGSHHVINDSRALQQLFKRIPIDGLGNRSAGGNRWAEHSAFGHPHAGGVCHDGLLIRNFGAIGK
ncbi:hypothetical protein D9M70_585130 [compost metagenome]